MSAEYAEHIVLESPCVQASGCRDRNGYSRRGQYGRSEYGHRVAYERFHGVPIPEGMTVDHVCHNADDSCSGGTSCRHRGCVNPRHLELVTQAENSRRAKAQRRRHVNRTDRQESK